MRVVPMIEVVALLPAFVVPPMSLANAFAPERAIATDLLPAANAALEGRPFPS